MNAWFPRLSRLNAILSGNAGIWHTACGESVRLSESGTTPCWAGLAPVWNMGDGRTMFNGQIIPRAYNAYAGSDDGRWAGATNDGTGQVDTHLNGFRQAQIPLATCPRFGGPWFAYLTPFQGERKQLIANGGVVPIRPEQGSPSNIAISQGGEVFVYQTATGVYTRKVWSKDGQDISVRTNEDPVAAFLGPDHQPWVVTNTPDFGLLVRPAFSAMGYRIEGDMSEPDARMVGDRLRIVASPAGQLRDVWIDFNAPRQDLRQH